MTFLEMHELTGLSSWLDFYYRFVENQDHQHKTEIKVKGSAEDAQEYVLNIQELMANCFREISGKLPTQRTILVLHDLVEDHRDLQNVHTFLNNLPTRRYE